MSPNRTSEQSPTPVQRAMSRVNRALALCAAGLVGVEVVWALLASVGWTAVALAAAGTVGLVGVQIAVLRGSVKNPDYFLGAIVGGYVAKVAIVLGCVKGADLLGADRFYVGISVLVTVLVVMFAEAMVLMRSRIPNVDPPR